MPIQVLIVGQTDRAEAAPLAAWITKDMARPGDLLDSLSPRQLPGRARALAPADVRSQKELADSLIRLSSENWIPDLIVVMQCWPDEFSATDVEQLNRFAPLARLVVCYGAWCESDGRNRDLWPLAVRVPIPRARSRLLLEWRLLNGGSFPAVPMSASREETFAADHPRLERLAEPTCVGVDSPDCAYRRYLEELLIDVGGLKPGETSSPAIVLFDMDPWCDRRRMELQHVVSDSSERRILALTSLPNPNDTSEWFSLGVAEVLPKLCDQQWIVAAIERIARRDPAG